MALLEFVKPEQAEKNVKEIYSLFTEMDHMLPLPIQMVRARAKINSQIFSVQAPVQQGAKIKEYQAYSVFSQRR